jgi:hypothetical protein
MSNSKKFKVGSLVKIVGTVHDSVQGKIIRVLPVGRNKYVVASTKDGSTEMQYVGTFDASNLKHRPLPCKFDEEVIASLNKEFTPVKNLSKNAIYSEDAFYDVWDEMPPKAPWMTKTDAVKPCGTHNVPIKDAGLQTHIEARFDCIPPEVLLLLAQCLGFGARKYGKDNWKKIEPWHHLNHAMNHINEWNRGNRDEPHLVNAMARLTFALWHAVRSQEQPDTYIHPDEKHNSYNTISGGKKDNDNI